MRKIGLTLFGALAASTLWATLPDPITYFSFDEKDSAGKIPNLASRGSDLTLGAGATITNFAAVGKALWFDGTTNAYSSFSSPIITNRTISFWYYRSMDPGPYFREHWQDTDKNCTMPTLISNFNSFYLRFDNYWADSTDFDKGGGGLSTIAWIGRGGELGGCYFAYPNYPQIGHERWVHMVYTFDFKSHTPDAEDPTQIREVFDAKIYVNGEVWYKGTDLSISNCCIATDAVVLGNVYANGKNGKRPFNGGLDEFRVFDSVLTADQIQEEFARGSKALKQRLVAWYPLQEYSAADGSGNFTTPDQTAYGKLKNKVLACTSDTSVTGGPKGPDKALHFNGTSLTGARGTVPFKLSDFTISAWVNVSTNTSIVRVSGETENYPKLLKMGNFSAYLVKGIAATKMQYTMPGDATVRTLENQNCIAGKGNWQHFTWIVRNERKNIETHANQINQHLELYVNGEWVKTGVTVGALSSAADTYFYLGTDSPSSTTRPFEGDFCDLRIYDGAMSADEVRQLFRAAATVDAGADQTVKGEKAVLKGTVAARNSEIGARFGYAGEVSWSLVSAPSGSAGTAIWRSANPVTEVTLPVEGTYVFKLQTQAAFGATSEDTVTIIRNDATGTEPVVPTVDVAAAAADAATRAGLSNGLLRYWPFNGGIPWVEQVKGTKSDLALDWSSVYVTNGVTGYGAGIRRGKQDVAFGSLEVSGETSTTNGTSKYGYLTSNEWLTVSAWIRPESDYPDDWYAGAISYIPSSLVIAYGKWWGPDKATGPISGLSILQIGIAGSQSYLNYDLPDGESIADKWSHVLARVNRWDTSKSDLYLNGVLLTKDTAKCVTPNYGDDATKYGALVGKPTGGRYQNAKICHAGISGEFANKNHIGFCASNTTTRIRYSRHFPGVVDEIRYYNRKLTETEIAYLAAHPDPAANAAPVVAQAARQTSGTVYKRTNQSITASAADDGLPSGGTLVYEWQVLRGDAGKVTFANAAAQSTTVQFLARGEYTLCLKVADGERTTYGEPLVVTVESPGMIMFIE